MSAGVLTEDKNHTRMVQGDLKERSGPTSVRKQKKKIAVSLQDPEDQCDRVFLFHQTLVRVLRALFPTEP